MDGGVWGGVENKEKDRNRYDMRQTAGLDRERTVMDGDQC